MKVADLVNAVTPRDKLIADINSFCEETNGCIECWDKYLDCAALRILTFTLGRVNGLCLTYLTLYGEDEQVRNVLDKYRKVFDRICQEASEFHLTKRQS